MVSKRTDPAAGLALVVATCLAALSGGCSLDRPFFRDFTSDVPTVRLQRGVQAWGTAVLAYDARLSDLERECVLGRELYALDGARTRPAAAPATTPGPTPAPPEPTPTTRPAAAARGSAPEATEGGATEFLTFADAPADERKSDAGRLNPADPAPPALPVRGPAAAPLDVSRLTPFTPELARARATLVTRYCVHVGALAERATIDRPAGSPRSGAAAATTQPLVEPAPPPPPLRAVPGNPPVDAVELLSRLDVDLQHGDRGVEPERLLDALEQDFAARSQWVAGAVVGVRDAQQAYYNAYQDRWYWDRRRKALDDLGATMARYQRVAAVDRQRLIFAMRVLSAALGELEQSRQPADETAVMAALASLEAVVGQSVQRLADPARPAP